MTTFTDADHPRELSGTGRFAAKTHSVPEDDLLPETMQEEHRPQPAYRIPASRLGEFQHRIDKANRRLERAGIVERFTFTSERRIVFDDRTGQPHETNEVTVNRPTISAGEWRFDGMHERAANGRILSHFSGAGPEIQVVDDLMACDHCGHRRDRAKVYTVTHPGTGETKQVGSNCLELFLGIKPQGLWTLDEDFDPGEPEEYDPDEVGGRTATANDVYPGDSVLVQTLRQITEDGEFVPRSQSFSRTPTADRVMGRLHSDAEPTPEERAELDELYAWLDDADGQDSEYIRNLKEALAPVPEERPGGTSFGRHVSTRHVPLVASAVSSFRRSKEKEAERRRRETLDARKKQEYLAPVGTKLKGRGIAATIISAREGQDYGYGAPTHVTMMDDDGHVLYWRSSGPLGQSILLDGGESMHWLPDDGARVVVTGGTVKDNRVNDYTGDWETVLTRAKLQPSEDVVNDLRQEARDA
ncbi:hypothetical protein [Microbacterium sp.]|uniref:hypothetical protein n=1 Tax=Microbacterium sp. TaxID=51671 RepID=UPI003F9B16C4